MEEARGDAGLTDSNVDVIREVNEAVAKGDYAAMAERTHPDVVWEHNIGVGSLEEGTYEGREQLVRLMERIIETWEWLRPEPRTIDRVGDDVYEVKGDLRAKHRLSDTEIDTTYEQRLEVRDGLLVRGKMTTGEISFR